MDILNDLYNRFDGPIPQRLLNIAEAGSLQSYTHHIAYAAEQQFQKLIMQTIGIIKHHRRAKNCMIKQGKFQNLSDQMFYNRQCALDAREIKIKNAPKPLP